MAERQQPVGNPLEESFDTTGSGEFNFLVLHNDEIHTMDYVVDSLIEVCRHDAEQAEQCTIIAHYKGQCDVKKGSVNELLPMKEGLTGKGLLATIE